MKTVRFTKIVEKLGTPEPYTLWLPPEKDRDFQAAIKAHRVMTVHQENTGNATDFGEIGFAKDVQGSFLLFPKSLKRYEGRRVVGVKYDLLKETPAELPTPEPKKPAKRKTHAEPEPKSAAREKPALSPATSAKFEPLRVFEAEKPKAQPKSIKPPALNELTREVRKAMKKLEQGNPVAAYQILEKSISSK